jgi:hypothetical protein
VEATAATGKVIILSATGNQTQLAGSVLRHADGTEYTLDANATTATTATKVLRAGHLSGRRRLYQGHAGAGFVTAVADEVYLASATGEYCALKDVENHSSLQRYLFDLYVELDAEPETHDQFVQQLGAVGSVTCSSTGKRGNKDPKDVLTIASPAGTVIAEAHIIYLRGGADAMSPAAMQQALRDLFAVRAGTGTIDDIREAALSYPYLDISECFVTPATHGINSYTILPVSADGQYIGTNELAELGAYVSARLSPSDRIYTSSVYEEVDYEIDFVNVQCSPIYEPDWKLPSEDLYGVAISVTGVSTLTLAVTPPMVEGDRVIVTSRGSNGAYIVQRRVTSIAGSDVTLDEPLPFPPDTVSAFFTPGGPLADAIITAVYDAYAARAPSVGATGSQVRFPVPGTTDDPQGILSAISRVEGVIDADFGADTPATLTNVGGVLIPSLVIRMYV